MDNERNIVSDKKEKIILSTEKIKLSTILKNRL